MVGEGRSHDRGSKSQPPELASRQHNACPLLHVPIACKRLLANLSVGAWLPVDQRAGFLRPLS